MPLQATSGAASYDAFGGGVPVVPAYIEEVFSTTLYTGNGSTQTITNGIDLSTKGGLVWIKNRTNTYGATNHVLTDTVRGASSQLASNSGNAATAEIDRLTSFNTNGFSLDSSIDVNGSENYVSWSFAETPKFFNVVTYTGDGTAGRTIAHNLGAVPACMIVKKTTSSASNWAVYHRSLGATKVIYLQLTDAAAIRNFSWNSTEPTSTVFTVGSGGEVNTSGQTYVAYLFAHDAGGFGLTGTDNVISCGSCVSDASGYIQPVNLGYEPQWVMLKRTNSAANWVMMDTMRGMANTAAAASPILLANTSAAEAATGVQVNPTATGFEDTLWGGWGASNTYIYIAIRRGPMKVPTSGTSVFAIDTRQASTPAFISNFPVDMSTYRAKSGSDWYLQSRMTAASLYTNSAASENSLGSVGSIDRWQYQTGWSSSGSAIPDLFSYMFRRAPGFFDEVCYLGNGSTQTITHNLGVVPELIIGKNRTTAGNNWPVLFNFASTTMNYGFLNLTNSCPNDTYANVGVFSAAPTSTSMFLVNSGSMNTNTNQHVAYLFASCAGVSKVFSYTGNGSSQTINCGFTGGARFVLIKRTDSTGDWYVWDSARGIVSGNDPHLSLNSTAAEVTTDDTIDTDSTGFVVNQVSATNVNVSSATYIGFAVA